MGIGGYGRVIWVTTMAAIRRNNLPKPSLFHCCFADSSGRSAWLNWRPCIQGERREEEWDRRRQSDWSGRWRSIPSSSIQNTFDAVIKPFCLITNLSLASACIMGCQIECSKGCYDQYAQNDILCTSITSNLQTSSKNWFSHHFGSIHCIWYVVQNISKPFFYLLT